MADQDNPQPPAGWYPDPTQPGQQRYWDGTQWTEHTAGGAAESEVSSTDQGTDGGTAPSGAYGAAGTYGAAGSYGAGGAYAGAGEKPDPWLWQSIVATILCCLPVGIAAIVFAAQSQSAIGTGDYATARDKAAKAKTWTLVSVGLGLVGILLGIVLLVFGAVGSVTIQ